MGWQIAFIIFVLIVVSISLWWINDRWRRRTLKLLEDIALRKSSEDDMAQHLKQLSILREVSEELSERLNIDSLLDIALDAALRLSGGAAGFIFIQNRPDDILKTLGKYDTSYLAELQLALLELDLNHYKPQLIIIPAKTKPAIPHLPETKAQMHIPLQAQERIIGIMNLETPYAVRFQENVFEFMQILGGRIGVALDNARLYRQAQNQVAELQTVYNKVQTLERLKTDMIRLAAHDLRNPLAVLMGYMEMMEQDKEAFLPEHQDYFTTINHVVKRMHSIVEEILSLERIEQIATRHPKEAFSLAPLIERAIAEYQWHIENKKLRLETDIQSKAPPVLGDKAQIHEAMINLLGNAVKYTPNGGKIRIRLAYQQELVAFSISDTGIGIPDDQQSRLFEPFFRLKNPEGTHIDGTGLGLNLVRNIVERHRGEMIFISKYGEGSTFGFRLPCAETITTSTNEADNMATTSA